ncbi:MAG: hypothetical protein WCI57_04005 [Candidatus Berkelbacteria bacterium]
MQNQNTNNLSPWDEDLPEETPPPAPQVGTLHAGPADQQQPVAGAFAVPSQVPAAQPAVATPVNPVAAPAQTAPVAQPVTPVQPVAPAVAAPQAATPAPVAPVAAAPVVPLQAATPGTVTSKFAAPSAAPIASFDDAMPNKFASPQSVATNVPSPTVAPGVAPAPAKKAPMNMKKKLIVFGSLALLIILFAFGIILTENGVISIGFENTYGKIGMEKLWGGLPQDANTALAKSFVAMSKQPSYKMKGSLSMTIDSSVESEITTPLVSMSDKQNYAMMDEDLSKGLIRALLAYDCIGCEAHPAPTITLYAIPATTITAGESTTLHWVTTNAVSCSGDWGTAAKNPVDPAGEVVSPTTNTNYNLTCQNDVGDTAAGALSIAVTAAPLVPTATLTANPIAIQTGASFTLDWSSTASTSCAATGSWTGAKGIAGPETIKPDKAGVYLYKITCTGSGGTSPVASATVTVTDAPPPPAPTPVAPTVTLSADKTSVAYGGSVKLTWGSTNAGSCSLNWGTSTAVSGSQTVSSLTSNKTYSVKCVGDGGSAEKNVTITVGEKPPVVPGPAVTLSVDKTSVEYNGSATLSWSSTNSTKCATSWTKLVTTSGTQLLSNLTSTANYTITCTGNGGSKTSNSVTITVAAAPPAVVVPTKPTATLSSDKTTAGYYDSVTLTWSSTDATTCAASWTLSTATKGSETVITYGTDATYSISCTGKGGSVTSNEVLVAFNAPVEPTPVEPTVRSQQISADITGSSSDNGISVNMSVENKTVASQSGIKSLVEVKNIGSKVWIKSDAFKFDQAATSDGWLEYNISSLTNTSLAKMIFFSDASARPTVKGARVGNESIDGVRCYHYTIDSLNIGNSLSVLGIKSDAAKMVKGNVWIGIKDKQIRKIELAISPSLSSSATDVSVSLAFSEFGKKNDISQPSVTDTIKATGEMFKAVSTGSAVSGSTATSGSTTTGTTVTTGSTTTGTTVTTGSTVTTGGTTVVPQTSVQVNDAQRKIDLASIKTALEDYKSIGGKYPVSASYVALNTTTNVVAKALVPKHLAALPVDPKASSGWYYAYKSANGTTFTLSTKLENLVDPTLTTVNGTSFYLLESTK